MNQNILLLQQQIQDKVLENTMMSNDEYMIQEHQVYEVQNALRICPSFDLIRWLLDAKNQRIAINVINSNQGQLILDFLEQQLSLQLDYLLHIQHPKKQLYDLIFILNKVLNISYCGNSQCFKQISQLVLNIGSIMYNKSFQLFHSTIVEVISKIIDKNIDNIDSQYYTEYMLKMFELNDLTLNELKLLISNWVKLYTNTNLPKQKLLILIIQKCVQSILFNKATKAIPDFLDLFFFVSRYIPINIGFNIYTLIQQYMLTISPDQFFNLCARFQQYFEDCNAEQLTPEMQQQLVEINNFIANIQKREYNTHS